MLDFVQVVSDHAGARRRPRRRLRPLGQRRDPRVGHQRHQARQSQRRRPSTSSSSSRPATPADALELTIRVRDQGEGFDPEIGRRSARRRRTSLKSSGRGIFLIRNFMDDVQLQRAPEGDGDPHGQARAAGRRRLRQAAITVLDVLHGLARRHSTIRCFSRPPPSRRSSAPAICRWRTSAAISRSTRRAPSIS